MRKKLPRRPCFRPNLQNEYPKQPRTNDRRSSVRLSVRRSLLLTSSSLLLCSTSQPAPAKSVCESSRSFSLELSPNRAGFRRPRSPCVRLRHHHNNIIIRVKFERNRWSRVESPSRRGCPLLSNNLIIIINRRKTGSSNNCRFPSCLQLAAHPEVRPGNIFVGVFTVEVKVICSLNSPVEKSALLVCSHKVHLKGFLLDYTSWRPQERRRNLSGARDSSGY